MLTVTDLKNYLYCPKIIYFKNTHKFIEPLQNNGLIKNGMLLHKNRYKYKQYSYKYFKGFISNKKEVKLYSEVLGLSGVVDEIFIYAQEIIPVEYKFSKYEGIVQETYILQLILYAYLIKEVYGRNVQRGYVIYTKDKVKCVEVIFEEDDFFRCRNYIENVISIITSQEIPKVNINQEKCTPCYFKKFCGSIP